MLAFVRQFAGFFDIHDGWMFGSVLKKSMHIYSTCKMFCVCLYGYNNNNKDVIVPLILPP